MNKLPITSILPDLLSSLQTAPNALLHAPPGAGKTTCVPTALLSASWLGDRRILMLEPRRIAARAAARFMAKSLGEEVGQTVGYRIRHETRISSVTRIEIVTEGILTRLLQADPELATYGIIIFDEFHERSIHADIGLALCIEAQSALRDDLRLLVMSATLDCTPVASLLGNCPIISSEGRCYPVTVLHTPPPKRAMPYTSNGTHIPLPVDHVAATIWHALTHESGSILVFLPGAGEIRRVEERLLQSALPVNTTVHPLYGDLNAREQDAAIAPAPSGTRKVVLATSIAETSLTIEGVRVVIDCGLTRHPRFDPNSGMTRLITERVSLAAAAQRQGRAGRLEAGICYRLWNKGDEPSMRRFDTPEIADADLAPLALELAAWGITGYTGVRSLPWLTPPPQGAYAQACTLLHDLEALDTAGHITPHGKQMLALPLHPRLAHMALTAVRHHLGATACITAALVSERDSRQAGTDIRGRVAQCAPMLSMLNNKSGKAIRDHSHAPTGRLAETVQHIARIMRHSHTSPSHYPENQQSVDTGRDQHNIMHPDTFHPDAAGECLALAYPDRLAQQRGNGVFRLSGGRTAFLPPEDSLAREPYLAVADLDGNAARARIWRAAPIQLSAIEDYFENEITEGSFIVWDSKSEAVAARTQKRLGALILADAPLADASGADMTQAVVDGIREIGLHCLPWTEEASSLRARILFLRKLDMGKEDTTPDRPNIQTADCVTTEQNALHSPWPNLSDAALMETLPDWLGPFLTGITRRSQFKQIDLCAAITSLLDWPLQQRLEREAPTHITVPSGSSIRLDYPLPGTQQDTTLDIELRGPVLPVKLQEMFGAQETPTIAGGRFPLLIHLLSPAGRPLQVTRDLVSFWKNGYPAVRAEMRGRYPKHPWPEDPTTAPPTRHVKRRMQSPA